MLTHRTSVYLKMLSLGPRRNTVCSFSSINTLKLYHKHSLSWRATPWVTPRSFKSISIVLRGLVLILGHTVPLVHGVYWHAGFT